jgi:hypothetical protein
VNILEENEKLKEIIKRNWGVKWKNTAI